VGGDPTSTHRAGAESGKAAESMGKVLLLLQGKPRVRGLKITMEGRGRKRAGDTTIQGGNKKDGNKAEEG